MQNSNRKIFDSLVSRTKIYLVLIFILLVIICILKTQMIIPSIVLFAVTIWYTYMANNKRKNEISEHLQDLTLNVNATAKNSLIHSPFPLIIVETDGNIIWRSTKFVSEFANIDIDYYINEILDKINIKIEEKKDEKDKSIKEEIEIGTKEYRILGEFVKSGVKDKKKQENKYMMILYFLDKTEENKIKKEYEDSKSCVGLIMIDNYEETLLQIDAEERPQVLAEIEKSIYEWANKIDGIIIKADRDRFVYIFEHRYLEIIRDEKFSILDTIKEINVKNKIQITLSIALSDDGETGKEKYLSAQGAMDVVLGRGGDQATILENGKYQFFGGRTPEVEKRTKVKARMVAHALEELLSETEQVMIMGHTNPDMDALGSALGIFRLAKTLGKEAFIVASTNGTALKEVIDDINEEGYQDVIINEEIAENLITPETLLVVVDTHKISYVEAPELLEKTGKIAIIDHHRRSTDFIKNSILTFHEVYASSAAELVTEILQYTEAQPKLTKFEAEALYAGIMMDTKNFTFKTGVRTFEAAAYLRKYSIDIIRVKKWFQSDLDTYKKITDIINETEVIKGTIGISTYNNGEDKDASVICAKAADELLTIGNITASFVIGSTENRVNISGRSIGDVNVQLILEKMGGGGHSTVAGAQFENRTIEDVKNELITKIDEYFEEGEN